MNSFEAGFFKEAMDGGLSFQQAAEMLKVSMAFSGATPMFNHQNLDGQADPQADPHQLQLAAAMQQQVQAEHQMHQMHQMLGMQQPQPQQQPMMQAQMGAQAPIGGPQ